MAGRPDSFGEAIFEIRAVDEQLTTALHKGEATIRQSVGVMGAEFNKLESSTLGVQQGMSALGPALSAVGGNAANIVGPLAAAGSTMAGLGTALLSIGGVVLVAGIAIAAMIARLMSFKNAAKEAAEAARTLADEMASIAWAEYVDQMSAANKQLNLIDTTIDKTRDAMEQLNAVTAEQKVQLAGDTILNQITADAEKLETVIAKAEGKLAILRNAMRDPLGWEKVQRPDELAKVLAAYETSVVDAKMGLDELYDYRIAVEGKMADDIAQLRGAARDEQWQAEMTAERQYHEWRVQIDAAYTQRIMSGRITKESEAFEFLQLQFERMLRETASQGMIEAAFPIFARLKNLSSEQREWMQRVAGIPSGETAAGGMAAPTMTGTAGLMAAGFTTPTLPAGGRTGGVGGSTESLLQQSLNVQQQQAVSLASIDAKTKRGGVSR